MKVLHVIGEDISHEIQVTRIEFDKGLVCAYRDNEDGNEELVGVFVATMYQSFVVLDQ